MSKTAKQVVLAVAFVALIGGVFVWARFPGLVGQVLARAGISCFGGETPEGTLKADEALKRYGFYFKESARESGITFVHQAPTLDKKLAHIMPIIASMGAGVSVVDFDRDGLPDIFVVNSGEGSKCALYRNLGKGKFEDVAEKVGLADLNTPGTGVCMGAVWGDFDNDGFEDVLLYKWGKPELYRNDGGNRFVRVTDKAGPDFPKWVNANTALWLDYDRDGKLDLFIAGYWRDDINLWDLKTTKIMPESFEYASNGGRKYLLRNKGDGTFEDVTKKVGINSTRWTLAAAAADLCGTGYPDIVLANDYGVSEFFCNNKGEKFVEVGDKTGIGKTPKSGMNASLGDVYNNGKLAIYISNISEPLNLVQGNNLWVPEIQKGDYPIYLNLAGQMHVEQGGWSWGARFGDLNNDGLLDLYLLNGYISADRKKSYWYDYSKIAGSLGGLISDAANWPPIGTQSLSGYQQKCLWLNKRGDFIDIAPAVGVTDTHDGRAVAFADFENRGVLDAVVANQKGPLLLYRNTVAEGRGWVQFELTGTKSNRSAIGASVTLHWKHEGSGKKVERQVQVVSGGDGYASQGMRRLHFGLGEEPKIDKVVIRWPSGTVQTLENPEINTLHKVEEPRS